MEKEVLLQKLGTLLKRMDEFDGDKALSDAAATLDDVILLIDESFSPAAIAAAKTL